MTKRSKQRSNSVNNYDSYRDRMRPKGYDKKVWNAMWKRAERAKAWAERTVKDCNWTRKASNSSLKMLGEYLHRDLKQLTISFYDYLEMRSHGRTFLGPLDPSAEKTWQMISKHKIGPKKTWKYDHTTHTTSARKEGKAWVDYSGKKIANPGLKHVSHSIKAIELKLYHHMIRAYQSGKVKRAKVIAKHLLSSKTLSKARLADVKHVAKARA